MSALPEPGPASASGTHPTAQRSRLASFLFWLIRSGTAKAATVNADTLRLVFRSRSREIPLGDIEATELKSGWYWDRMDIRHALGEAAVSGLARNDAQELAAGLEAARTEWWRGELAEQAELLRSVHERVVQLKDPPRYITSSIYRDLEHEARKVSSQLPKRWPDTLADDAEVRMLATIRRFLNESDEGDDPRRKANEAFVENELIRSRQFFDGVEAQPLTDEQRKAIVVDEDRNLVVAAAGSGKTSVIVAKAGWMVRRGDRHPSELLLLAFARDARDELAERVRRRLGDEVADNVTVRTFHSLGMSIIGEAQGRRPSLHRSAEDSKALTTLLQQIIDDLSAEGELSDALLKWFQSQFAPYRSEHEFRNWGEYWDYIRQYEIRSLQGEQVKSFEECEIANFLYLNGVPYEYEAPYEHDTETREKRQYQPDFYLPKAGIYIEHFGLNASGNPPPFVDREEYLESIEWKRRLHEEKGTILIETFSHEHSSGTLTDNLARKLAAHGVTPSPISHNEIFAVLEQQGWIDPFIRLVSTFLNHYKGARLSFEELDRRLRTRSDGYRQRAEAFLSVFRPVFERYRRTLRELRQIDFHDMINEATEHVKAGRYRSPFGYVLIDEFQDISPGRARLLEALLDQSLNAGDRLPPTQLFAVGDDWQAIYRFSGSDIAIMREFGKRFGNSERTDLETTFRCAEPIATAATKFVLANPAQIHKVVRTTRKMKGPCIHIGLPGTQGLSLLNEALGKIAVHAARHDGNPSVLLLGRYRHLRPKNLPSLSKQYPRLELSYKTVHGSKGLEADYVIVLGLCSGKYGFPTEITDDPLLDLVLPEPEQHPNAEERRLFYVAMTRAKRHVLLLAEGVSPSHFITELLDGGYEVSIFGRPPEKDVACPVCVKGRLMLRKNTRNGNTFYGCSNWPPYCEHMQPACSACGNGLPILEDEGIRCPDCDELFPPCPLSDCGGWLRPRDGKYGPFLGCSNYPVCNYTRNLPPSRRQSMR